MENDLGTWADFNVAMLGATAALAGLVIVASSVNIAEIIKERSLTARLAAGIAALVLALIASGLALVPGIGSLWFGILLLIATAGAGVFQVQATRTIFANSNPAAQARVPKSLFGFLPIIAYLVAAITVLLEHPAGLYFAAAGCVLAIVSAIVVSWVVLVEVLR